MKFLSIGSNLTALTSIIKQRRPELYHWTGIYNKSIISILKIWYVKQLKNVTIVNCIDKTFITLCFGLKLNIIFLLLL